MHRYFMLVLVYITTSALAACSQQSAPSPEQQPPEPAPQEPEPEPQASPPEPAASEPAPTKAPPLDVDPNLTTSINALGVDLYGRLRSRPGNLSIAPMSISLALAMTYAGARSETAAQMAKVLHFDMDADALNGAAERLLKSVSAGGGSGGELKIANRLFGEKSYTFEAPFLALTKERYGAELESVDFRGAPEQSRAKINGWVSERTERHIEEILPAESIDEDTRLVLVNAMFFKGRWTHPFPAKATSPGTFHTSATASAEIPMMHLTEELRYVQRDGVHVLEMPYADHDLAMTILLPEAANGLDALEASLTPERIGELRASLTSQRVAVTMPRFTVAPSEPISLKTTLIDLGMPLAFNPSRADFTGMANPPNEGDKLYIGNVFHRTFVEVNEEGTEAAAATAVQMQVRGIAAPPVELVADHPFLFLIHTRGTGAILFIGRVSDPSAPSS